MNIWVLIIHRISTKPQDDVFIPKSKLHQKNPSGLPLESYEKCDSIILN